MQFVLVHSPVVGPSTWRWVGDALRRRGHDVVVPDLRRHAVAGDPLWFARAAADAAPVRGSGDETVIVGHSGTGVVLPHAAEALPHPPRCMVFVDAGIPPESGSLDAGGDFLETLRGLAIDGLLPPWSRWWSDGVMDALIADEERRRIVEAELPRVPLAFYETPFTAPTRRRTTRAAYVLLSEAYRTDARRATSLGWPVVERIGGHLDIVNDEDAIAGILCGLVDAPRRQ
jgi:hypothetical protein